MRFATPVCVLVFAAQVICADDATDDITARAHAAWKTAREKQKEADAKTENYFKEEIAKAEAVLAAVKSARIVRGKRVYDQKKPLFVFPSPADRAREIESWEKDVRQRKAELFLFSNKNANAPHLYVDSIVLGAAGVLSYPDNVAHESRHPAKLRVLYVIDKSNVVVRSLNREYCIRCDTTGLVDDALFTIERPVFVADTIKVGLSTMFLLIPFDPPKPPTP